MRMNQIAAAVGVPMPEPEMSRASLMAHLIEEHSCLFTRHDSKAMPLEQLIKVHKANHCPS